MSRISLLIAADVSSIQLDGLTIFSSADKDEVGIKFKEVIDDLEALRKTVCKAMNIIKFKSDLSFAARDVKCQEFERALENAGVPLCDDIYTLNFEGFELKVGANIEPAEWDTNSPAFLEIVSATHRGVDATEFINTIGGDEAWEKLCAMIDLKTGERK